MKDVRELSVVQIRLFPVDTLPDIQPMYSILAEIVGSAFQFQGYGEGEQLSGMVGLPMPPNNRNQPNALEFSGGKFVDEDNRITFINSLSIEGRRIILQVAGTTEQADQIFEELKGLIIAVWQPSEIGLSEIIHKAEETMCVVSLDLDFSALFREELILFLNGELLEGISDQRVEASAKPVGFRTKISYEVKDRSIIEHGISLLPKDVIIEPRRDSPPDSRIFYTQSPLPTKKHFQMLENFESLFRGN